MPKIHRHRGVTTEVPLPTDPGIASAAAEVVEDDAVEVLTDTPDDVEPLADPGEVVEAIVVDEHGDDAAAVDAAPAPAPATRKRSR